MRADAPASRTPPTIHALLAARIDALPAAERRALDAASIEGRGFHRGAVRELSDGGDEVDAALDGLVQRELIQSGRSEFANETGYRFSHILVPTPRTSSCPSAAGQTSTLPTCGGFSPGMTAARPPTKSPATTSSRRTATTRS